LKILVDTNVIIASFLGSSACFELIEDARHNHQLYYSDQILAELKRNLVSKFHYTDKKAVEYLSFISGNFTKCRKIKEVKALCRDKSDDQIIADAIGNKLDMIITGDKDLLVLKVKNIVICSPNGYWIHSRF